MPSDDVDARRAPGARLPGGSPDGGVLGPRFRWVSIGMCALIMLAAFENLAVTTIMPTISRELDGAGLYAFAFAGPLAVSVVGMVVAGSWSDRGNPRTALYGSVALFAAGLLIAGLAPTMPLFVGGRLVHGLGGGALTVALYVIVARVYPPVLHPRIFAGFAAAWVIPSLIGPFVAGLVADHVGWRWVFLGVLALIVPAMGMVVPAMRGMRGPAQGEERPPRDLPRIGWAVLLAVAVLVLTLTAEATGVLQWAGPVVAGVVALLALRPLLPAGTLLARRGLPSVILMRGLVAGAFFAAEVYVPRLMVTQYEVSAPEAGLALTAAGLTWAVASWLQGRFPGLSHRTTATLGAAGLTIAMGSLISTVLFGLPPAVIVAGWAVSGAGMGVLFPRLGVLTLEDSTPADQGFNSAALSITDAIGSSIALAATAIVFSALGPLGGGWPFVGAFAVTSVFVVGVWLNGPRMLRQRA
ncbi:MFS transporter [Leifsonia sp. F6_8S_P_1B]|uniref:MFS transporter n=1 Tax=Leifsonia williamsii TaxID=3035919 RepID=A0ABT8KBS5_9MICO|nr:MFS transporter [Leifsonia williamsii]MDN4614251.1 MFS transporter [Leifsonia williamsii]